MRNLFIVYILFLTAFAYAQDIEVKQVRVIPKNTSVQSVEIEFNGDYIKGSYRVVDARTEKEKEENRSSNKLYGPVITFFHGHLQRADDASVLIDELALKSKSGIVIVPISYTPFGKKQKYRGDKGKDYILMGIIRYALEKKGIDVEGYVPLSVDTVKINGKLVEIPQTSDNYIKTTLLGMGWSHGGLLARRMVSRYPGAYTALAQMATSGYYDWGHKSCIAPSCILMNFSWEGAGISLGLFRGEASEIFGATWGITKGFFGDTFRSVPSCIWGNFHPFKPLRSYQDVQDVTDVLTDKNFPVSQVSHIVVMLGESDDLFSAEDVTGIEDKITDDKLKLFWEKFYPSAVSNGAKFTFRVLPGNHIGPFVHYKKYAYEALKGTDQLR